MVTSLGCCYRYSVGVPPPEASLMEFLQRAEEDGWGWDERCQRYGYGRLICGWHTKSRWEVGVVVH